MTMTTASASSRRLMRRLTVVLLLLLVVSCCCITLVRSQEEEEEEVSEEECPAPELLDSCSACCGTNDNNNNEAPSPPSSTTTTSTYNCSLPGLTDLTPGKYAGVQVNYLSFVTQTSSPNFPHRAREFEACTGGTIVFSEAANVWEDPVLDLGTKSSDNVRGSEVFDGYFMSYSHFPEVSSRDLAEHLNDRIRKDNARLKWEEILPKVKTMGEYRKNGATNIDFLMYDGDFFLPVIRIDLLERHNLALPNTWEEAVEIAKFFNGTDLNNDGDVTNDTGFCHFPREGAGYWDWWASEVMYAVWATSDQTQGIHEGFFFDQDTMEPRVSNNEGFVRAAKIWKDLWTHGSDACESLNFIQGRCALGFTPPGCLKGIFLNGVSRKDANGTVVWRPTMKNGEYAEPYRFRPFGSLNVVDRSTGKLTPCTPKLCPKAERIPAQGHFGVDDRVNSFLAISPLEGQLINRAPFYWSGGLGTLIRKSSPKIKKDMLWDFFVYTNSPETSVHDVANYISWLDSWRYSQLVPGDNFIQAGWSRNAYEEHNAIMQWALSADANGAFNLRLPGGAKYTRDVVGERMRKYIAGNLSLDDMVEEVHVGWKDITYQQGKLDQLEIYRSALGLDELSAVRLCRLHRDLMDEKDPSVCRKFDPISSDVLVIAIIVPVTIVVIAILVFIYFDRKRKATDLVWKIRPDELHYGNPPRVLGRGTFGLVLVAEYRGTLVAVKRVIPPKAKSEGGKPVSEDQIGMVSSKVLSRGPLDLYFEKQEHQSKAKKSAISSEAPLPVIREVEDSTDDENPVDKTKDGKTSATRPTSFGRKSDSTFFTGLLSKFERLKQGDEYSRLKADFILEMKQLSKLRHPCITTLMGAVCSKNSEPTLVMEYMDHGSLYDILHNETMIIDGEILLPILRDITQGVRFLHAASPQIVHSDLKSNNILVDSRFRAKVADFGLSQKRKVGAAGTPFWLAPEVLRGVTGNTPESDAYAFGIVLFEVYSRQDPYEGEDPMEVLHLVVDPEVNKRPPIPQSCPPKAQSLMEECLCVDPKQRPTFEEMDFHLKRLDVQTMEPIGVEVSKQNKKDRTDEFLLEVFPKHVADALRDGRKAEPLSRDICTVVFAEIVDFSTICASLSPIQVSDILDRLYTKLDSLCVAHDIFKVETIGDSYMAVTNLTKDQPDHTKRIAAFSIDAVRAAKETPIDPQDPLKGCVNLRIGFHSGPVVANVVGSLNPRLCLFGDVVNTSSRMERSSEMNRIHCSEDSARLLEEQCPEMQLRPRGFIHIKGKEGETFTYWVNEKALPGETVENLLHQQRKDNWAAGNSLPTESIEKLIENNSSSNAANSSRGHSSWDSIANRFRPFKPVYKPRRPSLEV